MITVMLLVAPRANVVNQPKATPADAGAAAERLAPRNGRLRTLWEKYKGVGIPAGVPWKERVTLRWWSEKVKQFGDPVERVDTRRVERDGAMAFVVSGKHLKGGRPPRSSEISDKDGLVWVVGTAVDTGPDSACYVRKK